MKSRMLLAIAYIIVTASLRAAPILKSDLTQGQMKAAAVCASCHTVDGNSNIATYPILAGQFTEYLQKQLIDFRSGKRNNAIMQPWAQGLSDQDILNVSVYYASQKLKARSASNKELVNIGEKIYRDGLPEKKVPACMGCHGPRGAGIPIQYPRLASQHASYTEAQLQSFKKAMRPATVMNDIALQLSDEQIKALAEYISGLH